MLYGQKWWQEQGVLALLLPQTAALNLSVAAARTLCAAFLAGILSGSTHSVSARSHLLTLGNMLRSQ